MQADVETRHKADIRASEVGNALAKAVSGVSLKKQVEDLTRREFILTESFNRQIKEHLEIIKAKEEEHLKLVK